MPTTAQNLIDHSNILCVLRRRVVLCSKPLLFSLVSTTRHSLMIPFPLYSLNIAVQYPHYRVFSWPSTGIAPRASRGIPSFYIYVATCGQNGLCVDLALVSHCDDCVGSGFYENIAHFEREA